MSTAGRREVARRLFAVEFDQATVTLSSDDEERAPNYQLSPTGSLVNRVFVVGALTAVEWVNEDTLRARIADPTGTFVVYASQYQQEARAALDELTPPAFVAVTGKANAFHPDGANRTYTSIRPEAVATVDRTTRDRWTVRTARHTFDRIGRMATVLAGGELGDEYVSRAIDEYGVTAGYLAALFEVTVSALEVIAGDRDVTESVVLDPANTAAPTVPLDQLTALAPEHEATDRQVPSATPAAGAELTADSGVTAAEEPDAPMSPTDDQAVTGDDRSTAAESPSDTEDSGPTSTGADVTEEEPTVAGSEAVDMGADPVDRDAATEVSSDDMSAFDRDADTDLDVPEEVLSDDERAEVEETYGTEFTTGAAVEPPTDEPTESVEPSSTETTATPTDEETTTPAVDADELDDRIVTLMEELEDGAGVPEDELVTAATERFDVDADAARAAIQEALMDGKCYEPTEDTYLPI